MPWDSVKLNNGYEIPSIGFGTWKRGNGNGPIGEVKQALSVGLRHIDTAQIYRNEYETGIGLEESGLKREDIFVTTKWSGMDGLNASTSIQNSLAYLNLSYVDLYLVHAPSVAKPDIPTAWAQMEELLDKGYTKSIGISNFQVSHMKELIASAKVTPAVNQIEFHPYVYTKQLPILEYAKTHGIVIEAYSPLTPVVTQPGGTLDKPLGQIGAQHGAAPDQILLAWAKAKGTVPVTTSSKKERLEGYLAAGDLELTSHDIDTLDAAGAASPVRAVHSSKAGGFLFLLLVLALVTYGVVSHVRRKRAQSKGIQLPTDEDA